MVLDMLAESGFIGTVLFSMLLFKIFVNLYHLFRFEKIVVLLSKFFRFNY